MPNSLKNQPALVGQILINSLPTTYK